ncbi:MAG: hypothetical protein WA874_06950 [Chryseosolibacter sp.]
MNKVLVTAIVLIVLAFGGYSLYQILMPKMVAEAVVSESLPGYIPKRLKTRVESMRAPINKGAEAMMKKMHESNVSVDQVLEAVDDISEAQAYAFLDELNKREPKNTNEVFDVAKKHFSPTFDLEIFRQPFNQYFEMKQVKKAIAYANFNRKSNDVDISTAKAILKKIIIEKEKEVSNH